MKLYPIDTHCHLHFPQYGHDRESVISSIFDKGMPWLVNVATEPNDIPLVKELWRMDDRILPTIGVHPHYVVNLAEDDWHLIERELSDKGVFVAVGEVGLDLYRNLSPLNVQIMAFERFLDLAERHNLPLIIHSRDADKELIEVMDSFGPSRIRFVVHCFSGDKVFAGKILDRGGYLSFTGNITYKKADNIREAAVFAPNERIMLETDSPYLAPQKARGQRNTPLNVLDVAMRISEEKGLDLRIVVETCNKNAEDFFLANRNKEG